MLLPADRLLELLQGELNALGRLSDSSGDVSAGQSSAMALQLLRERERGGVETVYAQFDRLSEALTALSRELPASAASQVRSVDAIRSALPTPEDRLELCQLEARWRQTLQQVEELVGQIHASSAARGTPRQLMDLLVSWETGDLISQAGRHSVPSRGPSGHVDGPRLQAYLQDRFADPDLRVTAFVPLAGGFGKQTFLFETSGRELSGSFVMRRDFPHPLVDNDCHRIRNEYAVIRAVHRRGFPAPEALWLDTQHELLPGGDFIVMRRSPGISGGTVLKPNAKVPDGLAQTLAQILARLHTLPPMEELARLTESINRERWGLPLDACVRHYLKDWLSLVQRTTHLPSPASMALYGWISDHVPPMSGQPVLVHGDVGFHNFLLDDGQLTAVLDWEFSHLGDPAEDIASVFNAMGDTLEWESFIRCYRAAGGLEVDKARVHFFRVWGHLRNALCSLLAASIFIDGRADDIKFVITPHVYVPQFLRAALALIHQGS